MRKHRTEELIAGAVLVAGIALMVLLLALIADQLEPSESMAVNVVFTDARGLKRGDPVFFHGVPCGRVSSLRHERRAWRELWPEEPDAAQVKVVLALEVDAALRPFLRAAADVTIEKTITGITAVIVREGTGELATPGAYLRGDDGVALEELATEARGVSRAIQALVAEVRGVVDDVRQGDRLKDTLRALNGTARNVEAASATVRDLAQESAEAFARIAANADSLVGALTEHVAPEAPALAAAVHSAAAVSEDLAAASGDIRSFVRRNRHRFDGTMHDAADAAANVAEATAEIRRQPWRLLYRPSPEECSTLGILDAVREYNLATARLERALGELVVLKDGPPELMSFSERARADAEAALGQYRAAESALWAELTR